MPEVSGFPDCCGFIVVNKFQGGHPGSNEDSCCAPSTCDKYLGTQEKEYYGKRAGLMAVLSEPQNERLADVFTKRKWKMLLDGIPNPRTDQLLYFWFRDLNPSPARHKRIFGE